jgi:hypothetical protein
MRGCPEDYEDGSAERTATLEEVAKLLNRHGISIEPILRSFKIGKVILRLS